MGSDMCIRDSFFGDEEVNRLFLRSAHVVVARALVAEVAGLRPHGSPPLLLIRSRCTLVVKHTSCCVLWRAASAAMSACLSFCLFSTSSAAD